MTEVSKSTSNVERFREAQQNFSRGKLKEARKYDADDIAFTDRARGLSARGSHKFLEWLQGWKEAFPDGRIHDPTYIDAGDTVVSLFRARGTNEGPFGPFPATGKQVDVPMCDIWHFNDEGEVVSAEFYYDQMTFLAQLGHIEEPVTQ